jgi:large repetitive protein
MKSFLFMLALGVLFFLSSCGSSTAPTTYTIGGLISGVTGTGLVLQDNGIDNLPISPGATSFIFATALTADSPYAVTVLTQPSSPAQTCVVTFGTGTVSATVNNIQIACNNNTFTIGGSVTGLSGTGLVLQDNGGSNLPISANGSFTFPSPVQRGSNYNVSVFSQPSGPAQTCQVSNGFGTNLNGNTTVIQVSCFTTTVTYTVGGTVSGLSGTGLVLQDNSGNNLPVSANGSFTFSTPVASGSTYSVTVYTQPSGPAQNCVVLGGGGAATANITAIQVNCTTVPFSIGGTISGLTGAGLVLQDNGGDNLPISSSATAFTFATQVASGSNYTVTVLTQPSGQTCTVASGSGTVTNAAITNVVVSCSGGAANVAVTVSGLLPNTRVVLQNNGRDDLSVASAGITTNFNSPVAGGSSYAVTVLAQPVGATCTVAPNGSGTLTSANVNIAVSCGNIIAIGEAHTCALTNVGQVLCWGLNDYGQLGNGTTTNSSVPQPVIELPHDVISISAGANSTCALTNAGVVWCWGGNAAGQLGDGTYTQSSEPVQVSDVTGTAALNEVAVISSGRDHACAATAAGAAYCWGDNSTGELGNGTDTSSNFPVPIPGLSSGVATISAGSGFTCAVTTAEAALCWGKGGSGQLGDGNGVDSASPVTVVDAIGQEPLGGVIAISAGFESACAVTSEETLLCWGTNAANQLGSGSTASQSSIPVQVLNSAGNAPLAGVIAISAGESNNCAVTSSGSALCWGENADREGGNDSSLSATGPAAVFGLLNGAVAIAAGNQYSCAVSIAGAAQCWGSTSNAQAADPVNDAATFSAPASAAGLGGVASLKLF